MPGELFARKRQKLRQWVADTSFPEIDELCSKGLDTSMLMSPFISIIYDVMDWMRNFLRYDFVSVLVGRLFPQSKEDKV